MATLFGNFKGIPPIHLPKLPICSGLKGHPHSRLVSATRGPVERCARRRLRYAGRIPDTCSVKNARPRRIAVASDLIGPRSLSGECPPRGVPATGLYITPIPGRGAETQLLCPIPTRSSEPSQPARCPCLVVHTSGRSSKPPADSPLRQPSPGPPAGGNTARPQEDQGNWDEEGDA